MSGSPVEKIYKKVILVINALLIILGCMQQLQLLYPESRRELQNKIN